MPAISGPRHLRRFPATRGPGSLWLDRDGAIAIIFTLALVPILGLVGLVIDYGLATQANAQLSAAADSAALAATTSAANAAANGQPQSTAVAVGQLAGLQWFAAQAGIPVGQSSGIMNSNTQAPVVTVVPTATSFSATVTYQSTVTSFLGRMFGYDSYAIAGSSGATISTTDNHVAIQVLMDTSSSMGIGATVSDITTLGTALLQAPFTNVSNTAVGDGFFPAGEGCGFACHYSSSTLTLDSGQTVPGYTNDFYGVAKYLGLTLRMDVLRAAVQNLITQLAAANTASQLQIGLYTFATNFTTAYALSSDMSGAQRATAAIDVEFTTPYGPYPTPAVPDTFFSNAMAQLTAATPASGDGTSNASPHRFLFIITDGMTDQNTGSSTSDRTLGPISPSDCAALKAKGVQILVLYTTYTPLTVAPNGQLPSSPVNFDDGFYDANVSPFLTTTNANGDNQVGAALRACASQSSYLITATSANDVNAALQKFLAIATTTPARVTH